MPAAVYGTLRPDVAPTPKNARQLSPLVPGSDDIAAAADGAWDEVVAQVPPGAAEARYVLAQALRVLKPGGLLTAAAPKDKGGLRIRKILAGLGCEVAETSRRHHRICTVERPAQVVGLDAAIADQAVYYLPIVQDSANVAVETGALLSHGKSFNLNPGFICTEYKIAANERGEFALTLSV